MHYHEEVFDEDKEYENHIVSCPPTIVRESFVKIPNKIIRNPFYQKWRATSRASVADFLFGFVIRNKCGNPIADHLYNEYYVKKKLLVARFTHQGLAERLGYKDRRGINNHMVVLEEEEVFKVHIEPWRNREIRVYEFGAWENLQGCNYIEIIHMHRKFSKILTEHNLEKLL